MRKKPSNHSVMATWLGVTLLLMQSLVHAETETLERIEWKKAPIRLELVVGQEQRIEFPATVKVGVPASVQGVLRTQSVNGMVYLLAHTSFGSNRLMVRELDSGRIYLFDVTATEDGGPGHPIQIYVTGEQGSEKGQATGGHEPEQERPDFIQLTRFAAQQLYAPARLVKDQPGIVRVPVSRDPVDLYHGGSRRRGPAGGMARQGSLYHGGQAHQPYRTGANTGPTQPSRHLADGNLSAPPSVSQRR